MVAMLTLVVAASSEQAWPACDSIADPFNTTAPVAGLPWTPYAITLVKEQLAPNVFAVYDSTAPTNGPLGYPLATSSGFVIGADGVLIVDTMVNRQLTCQLIALIRTETALPVLFAVNTNHHGDHSFGNAFLPADVQVIQHAKTAEHIAADVGLAHELAFFELYWGTTQGFDEVTPRAADIQVSNAGYTVDLGGGVTVEAQWHGVCQSPGDLFVSVPSAKVLFTGNNVISEWKAIPWQIDGHIRECAATLSALQASLPADTIIVPGHGTPVTPATISWSVDYLRTLWSEVSSVCV
jgi:glyoxylase-like metal-dependent hydrolase (beta-lactamase superfamily II)